MKCVVLGLLLIGCVDSSVVQCENGSTCPAGTACDYAHPAAICVAPEQLESCRSLGDGDPCIIETAGDGICDQGVCVEERCGDGYLRGDEQCDGEEFIETASCRLLGFYETTVPACTADCTLDRDSCTQECGDGVVQSEFELCEANVPPTATCVDVGFGAGVLGCNTNCGANTAACISFDWRYETLPDSPGDVHGTSDSNIFVNTNSGLMYFDGTQWKPVDASGCPGLGVNAMWAVEGGTIWVVGTDSKVSRLGATPCMTWTVTTGDPIVDIWAADASTAFVLTQGGVLWRFAANAWGMVGQGGVEGFALWGSSATNVWAMSFTSNGTELRHFDGTMLGDMHVLARPRTPRAIWGDATAVYVGGADDMPTSLGVVTRFDGTNETVLFSNDPILGATQSSVDGGMIVNGRMYITASRYSPGFATRILVHDGTGWTDLDVPTVELPRVWVSSGNKIYTPVGTTKDLAVLDGTLRLDNEIGAGARFTQLAAAATDDVYAAFRDVGGLYHWDGNAWTFIRNDITDIAADGAGNIYGIGINGVYTPGGVTAQPTGDRIAPLGPTSLWVLDQPSRRAYYWNGTSIQNLRTWPNQRACNDIWAASSASAFLICNTDDPSVWEVVHWNGTAWTTTPLNASNFLRLWGRSATDVYAVAATTLLHYNGTAWTSLPLPAGTLAYDVWGPAANDLFLATFDGLLHFDGAQWSPVASGLELFINAVTGVGASVFFADFRGSTHQLVRLVPWPAF